MPIIPTMKASGEQHGQGHPSIAARPFQVRELTTIPAVADTEFESYADATSECYSSSSSCFSTSRQASCSSSDLVCVGIQQQPVLSYGQWLARRLFLLDCQFLAYCILTHVLYGVKTARHLCSRGAAEASSSWVAAALCGNTAAAAAAGSGCWLPKLARHVGVSWDSMKLLLKLEYLLHRVVRAVQVGPCCGCLLCSIPWCSQSCFFCSGDLSLDCTLHSMLLRQQQLAAQPCQRVV